MTGLETGIFGRFIQSVNSEERTLTWQDVVSGCIRGDMPKANCYHPSITDNEDATKMSWFDFATKTFVGRINKDANDKCPISEIATQHMALIPISTPNMLWLNFATRTFVGRINKGVLKLWVVRCPKCGLSRLMCSSSECGESNDTR
jgi:hypothetical protein